MSEIEDPTGWKMSPLRKRRHRRERARYGFSTYDWWNFDSYLAWVNIQGLERFKDGAGHPADLSNMDEWRELLDVMIDGFRATIELSEATDNFKELYERQARGFKVYGERFTSLWD